MPASGVGSSVTHCTWCELGPYLLVLIAVSATEITNGPARCELGPYLLVLITVSAARLSVTTTARPHCVVPFSENPELPKGFSSTLRVGQNL